MYPNMEMTARRGSLLFPELKFQMSGMKNDEIYQISIHFEMIDNVRMTLDTDGVNFVKSEKRNALPHHNSRVFTHPAGCQTGAEWMKSAIGFNQVKLVNKEEYVKGENFMLHLVEPEEVGAMRAALNLIGSMVLPMDTSNCSDRHDTPSAPEFLRNLEPFQTVLLSISSVTTIIVLTLSLIHWFYVYNYVSIEKRRNKLYWLIAVFPVACTCSFVAMCVPRTAVILTSIGILYYLMCLFVIVSLARHLFGGRESFSTCLQYDDRPIDFRSPPFCCILPKLPTARSTERNIRRLEWCVLQAPIVRSIIILFDVVAVAELREDATPFIRYSDMATLCSLLLAIFGVHTLARVTSNKLSAYCFMSMFRLVDISLFFFSAQQPIIFQNVLLRFNLISCGPLLNSQENAYFVCNFIITCEMLLLSALATWLLAPRHNAMFDAYRQSMTLSETTASLNETEQSMIEQDI